MRLDPWLLRDPETFLRDLHALVPVAHGLTVSLVHEPSTAQHLVAAATIHRPEKVPGYDARDDLHSSLVSDLLRRAATALWGDDDPGWQRPEHAFVTTIVRDGRVVFGPGEYDVLAAWRYSNHCLPVFGGDLVLVTQHGWRTFAEDLCGALPALAG
jgi:hypothetical protein